MYTKRQQTLPGLRFLFFLAASFNECSCSQPVRAGRLLSSPAIPTALVPFARRDKQPCAMATSLLLIPTFHFRPNLDHRCVRNFY